MPQQGITFGGAFIGLPGAYYQDDVTAGAPNTPPTTPPLIFLGYSWGLKPQTPTTFTNIQDLQNAMRGGPAAAFIPFIGNPSPLLNGAQQVTFIDVSENTQSAASLYNSGGVASGNVYALLKSALYGPPSNRLQYQVEAPSISGVKLVLIDNYAGTEIVGDNLTSPFELAYVGMASGDVTFSVVSGATSGSFSISSPVSGESLTIAIGSGSYQTVSQLVEALNGTSIAIAQVISSTNGQGAANLLDAQTSVALPVSGSGSPNYVPVTAIANDLIYWVNQFATNFATAVSGAGIGGTAAHLPVTGNVTYFSGANGVPPVNADYASGFNRALTVPGWTIIADSNTQAVQALMTQHVEMASSAPYGMWRRGFTGSSIGDSVSQTQTNALALDSLQMNYLYPGIYRTDTGTGINTLYGGLYVAAAAAAIATGNQIALPLTNKPLNGTGVERPSASPLTPSQLVALQNDGVMAIYQPQNTQIPTILSDVTTWQVDNNVANTSSQQVACRYWLAYSVINVLQPYVGSIAAPTSEANILRALTTLLNSLIYTGSGSNGVLASWDKGSLQLTYTGAQELASITFNATLVGQNRYITCYASIEPLNFSITASN